MTFDELKLSAPLLDAASALGFTEAMPVQAAVIPYLLEDNIDLIALAQTGTGKTAAYGLPLLEKLRPQRDFPQALVLSPTRELCLQIASDLESFAKFLPEVRVLAVYGSFSDNTFFLVYLKNLESHAGLNILKFSNIIHPLIFCTGAIILPQCSHTPPGTGDTVLPHLQLHLLLCTT